MKKSLFLSFIAAAALLAVSCDKNKASQGGVVTVGENFVSFSVASVGVYCADEHCTLLLCGAKMEFSNPLDTLPVPSLYLDYPEKNLGKELEYTGSEVAGMITALDPDDEIEAEVEISAEVILKNSGTIKVERNGNSWSVEIKNAKPKECEEDVITVHYSGTPIQTDHPLMNW